jgi:hypothetical protein
MVHTTTMRLNLFIKKNICSNGYNTNIDNILVKMYNLHTKL